MRPSIRMLPAAGALTGPDVPSRIGALADLDHLVRRPETVELAGLGLRLCAAGEVAVTDQVDGGLARLRGDTNAMAAGAQLLGDVHRGAQRRGLGGADDGRFGT